jgi:hypothetical protein
MYYLILMLLLMPLAVHAETGSSSNDSGTSETGQSSAEDANDKRSDTRKKIDEETAAWVKKIQEDDARRRANK